MDNSISSSLSHQAIHAALSSQWGEALRLNRQIIKLDPLNVDALNRQARAYMELGKFHLAKKYYNLALKVDPYNPIAIKNLKIIKAFKANGFAKSLETNGPPSKLSPSLFLQEPGKTKVVNLLKVAEPQRLSQTYCGMEVNMNIKSRRVTIVDKSGGYLGVLPDDICHLIVRLLRGGNKYDVFIKSIRVNGLSVLIRETFRSKRFRNQSSFLDAHTHLPTSDIIISVDTDDDNNEEVDEEESSEI